MNKCENENETIQEFCIILREREEEEDFKFMGPKAHYQIGLGPETAVQSSFVIGILWVVVQN